ncbi:E3 ubiquitin/ISG15 ligase TRIM25-like [Pseudophryne corroboree]|uniref:E3 ubiquitin/ISG15 ligase TRIM25-like n=1 Tax=Pseudophryne corroboree TaxID=495146 RepID=UPI0030813B50
MASACLREELSCSICLSLYTDPVSLRCGHNFCRDCIVRVLDTQEEAGEYSCPECRAEYQERPALEKNRKLSNIAKHFLLTPLHSEESGVSCMYCLQAPVPAVKTCLQCETSLCEDHLRVHNKSLDHVLIEPTSSLENRKCQTHKKLLEYHCCEDAACICVSCFVTGPHKGHQVQSLDEAVRVKKKKLRDHLEKLTSRTGDMEKRVQSLQDHRRKVQEKVADATERVTDLFLDLRKQLQDLETRALSEISRQEDEILLGISDLIQQLETQKGELSRMMGHIEELCNVADPLTVLQDGESDQSDLENSAKIDHTQGGDEKDFDEGLVTVILHTALSELSAGAKGRFCVPEATALSLDINTATNNVFVKPASCSQTQSFWDPIDYIFDDSDWKIVDDIASFAHRLMCTQLYCQVLSNTVFSKGQHYWEVEASNSAYWMVGVACASIDRKGMESKLVVKELSSWPAFSQCSGNLYSFSLLGSGVAGLHSPSTRLVVKELSSWPAFSQCSGNLYSFSLLGSGVAGLHSPSTQPLRTFNQPPFSVPNVSSVNSMQKESSQMASVCLREELSCSICLSLYTDPVSLRCGHNFCRDCIVKVLDTQEKAGGYSCPECRAEYQERPVLEKNRKLSNIAKHFLLTPLHLEEPGVSCMYCPQAPVPAVKTCLQCETALCEDHLRIHNRSLDHVLIEPTSSLENRKCPTHKKLLEYHCCEDAASICVSCFVTGPHKGHQVLSLDEAVRVKKKILREHLEKLTSRTGDMEKRVQSLQDHRRKVQEKVADATERVTDLFLDLRKQLQDLETQVLNEISRQEEEISLGISDLIQQLETQKGELSRVMGHIEELCNMADPLTVLQDEESDLGDFENSAKVDLTQGGDEKDYDEGLVTVILHTALSELSAGAKGRFCVPEATDLSLDIDTATNNVIVSGDLKFASWSQAQQGREEKPERFMSFCQVLSKTTFSKGQHYWEVEASNSAYWMVGVACASIDRKGESSKVGNNTKSWCLNRVDNRHLMMHNSVSTTLYPESPVCRLGIYLDYEAGRLSFYQLCDSIRHLHTFSATFTEPLHAAFLVWQNGWVRLKC